MKWLKPGKSKPANTANTPEKNPYRAVRIKANRQKACSAMQGLSKDVFLCSEAPWLPLEACETKNACRCRYEHLSDRRTYLRRDTDNGLPDARVDRDHRSHAERRRIHI